MSEAGDNGLPSFVESSTQVYEIGPLEARLGPLDERVTFGAISDLLPTPNGYFVADGLLPRVVLLDRSLDPLRIIGGEGEGPGEYLSPRGLARAEDRVLVLDGGNPRVTYLTLDGDFVTSQMVPGVVSDVASHPDLGLFVASTDDPGHYLARVTAEGATPFGPIPEALRVEVADPEQVRWPVDLVTVTGDGTIHVLDQRHLALVSFRPDGELASASFLPSELRARVLERREESLRAHGGPERVLGIQSVTMLRPLEDGRVFVQHTARGPGGARTKGLVLDLQRLEAIPLTFPAEGEDGEWLGGSGAHLDGPDRVVLHNPLLGLATAPVELVAREP